MSGKKPNLRIEIEQSGDEYNSKFQGYVVEYPPQNYNLQESSSKIENIPDIYSSRVSHKSNMSNTSQRSALLQRAQQLLLEERLENNIKSLSKNKLKSLSLAKNNQSSSNNNSKRNSRVQQRKYDDRIRYSNMKESQGLKQVPRSKSTNAINAEQTRAKVLQEIAEKLQKIAKIKKDDQKDQIQQTKSQVHYQANSRVHSDDNSQGPSSRVDRIKQIKQQMIKNRGGKLEHLLKDIKKSNKQAYKVVYTIKKCAKNGSPFEKSLQMRDKIYQQSKKPITNANTIPAPNLFNIQKSQTLKQIAQELQHVRLELKEVKNKNNQLLELSQSRSAHHYGQYNLDTGSQSSRITNQIEALEFEIASNSSHRRPNSPQPIPTVPNPSFIKIQNKNSSLYSAKNNSYQIIQQPNLIQPCFACGCTCRVKQTLIK